MVSHADPVAPTLIALVGMAFAAAIGGRVMRKFGQAAVLGELLIGVLLGNIGYLHHQPLITIIREGDTISTVKQTALMKRVTLWEATRETLSPGPHTERIAQILEGPAGLRTLDVYSFVDQVSRIASIILLFLVGLETSLVEMREVGWSASLEETLGVLLPLALSLLATRFLLQKSSFATHLFIGGILTATSVGITARVLRDLLSPIESLIVPIFFVLMGLEVKLEAFNSLRIVFLALTLTVVAIAGKILSGYLVGRGLNRLAIGIGMMPREEVGLIFAGIGRSLGVVNDSVFELIVSMVIITTLLTPPLLKLTLADRSYGATKRAAA